MRLKNDTKLDYNSISSLEPEEMIKRVVEHMNLFIDDVSQVVGNIDVANLAKAEIKTYTLNSGNDAILSAIGYNAIILETSNRITGFSLIQKSNGLVLNVTTIDGNSTTLKILLLKL